MIFTRERLARALAGLGAEADPELFVQLETMYGAPDRHYHTGQHIAECLRALDHFSSLAERAFEVEVALWFHDAIYDSRRADNEELSAMFATSELARLGADSEAVRRIEAMIVATKSHSAQGTDAELLLDIDLGILGQSPAIFADYDEAIRREFSWVPRAQHQLGRSAVLKSFLQRPHIYSTGEFRSLYEEQARMNLASRLEGFGA